MPAATRRPITPTTAKRPRGPGRPVGGDAAVRDALLEHARRLFLRHGFADVGTRRIAAAAGTTPAMIRYYFKDKLGLYRAMIEEAMRPVQAELQRAVAAPAGAPLDVETILRLYMEMLAANRWLPALIVHEVLDEGGQLREQFIANFAGRIAPMLVQVLRREQSQGTMRPDVEPELAAVSAISLCVFPFVSLPITGRVLGLSLQGEGLERVVSHTTRLFRAGIALP
jgi:TetR/AcrR family transcriptional regulator